MCWLGDAGGGAQTQGLGPQAGRTWQPRLLQGRPLCPEVQPQENMQAFGSDPGLCVMGLHAWLVHMSHSSCRFCHLANDGKGHGYVAVLFHSHHALCQGAGLVTW